MSLPPQPPSSEEPEKKPVIHPVEETPEQSSPTSDIQPDEAEKQPVISASEELPTQPASTLEPQEDNLAAHPVLPSTPDETEAPTQVWTNASTADVSEASTQAWINASTPAEPEAPTADVSEAPTQVWSDGEPPKWTENEGTAPDWTDASAPAEENGLSAEDENIEISEIPSADGQSTRAGIFIHRSILIAAAAILVLAILLVSLLFFLNSPKDPPTDWIASYTPTSTTSTSGKILYYLHWTNQNGDLKGQLQLAAVSNGAPQSLTAPTTGLYNRDNHIIYVVIVVSGNQDVLLGKINDSNDTLTLNPVGATDTTNQIVFHKGSAADYKAQTKQLDAKK